MPNIKALNVADHSLHSSYREMLLEHLFVGEVMRHLWVSGGKRLEILKPQVDDTGYDLVLELGQIVRHIQHKTSFGGSTVRRFNINAGLAVKPSGCVICIQFKKENLDLGPFLWFGAAPGKPLLDISGFPTAKHTKGNAKGVKTQRPNLKVVPYSAFEQVPDIDQLIVKLFGAQNDGKRSQ
jgi:hypothetical protein